METQNASVDNSTLATDAGGSTATDTLEGLTNFFAAQESSQIDNSDSQTDDAAAADGSETTGDKGETPEQDAQTDAAEAKPDETQTAADEPAEDTANFDALNTDKKFLTADELKAKFPRNSSKELIAEAAQYAEAARQGHEVVQRLGGEHYVPVLEKIAGGLQAGETRPIFEGIIEAASSEGLLTVLGDALDIALFQADHFTQKPETADFGNALKALGDAAIKKRFGDSVSLETLEKLGSLAELGWLEKIEKWQKEEWVDRDELDALLKAGNDPKLRAQIAENARLKAQIEERNREAQQAATAQANELDGTFQRTVTDQIGKTLNDVVLSTSVLRDLATDTPEIKEAKEMLRSTIHVRAMEAFNASGARAELAKAFRQGKAPTPVYQTALVKAINAALLEVKPITSTGEKMIAKMYGNTRNSKLKSEKQQNAANTGLEPTNTAPREGETSAQPKTSDDILQEMENRFAALG